jgi:hypothetical protein
MPIHGIFIFSKSASISGIRGFGLGLIACICAACRSSPPTSAIQTVPTTPELLLVTESTSPLYVEEWNNWQSGPHSAAYDLGKGPNTYCARCHSPQNWDSNARIDPPPNCVSCKFASEDSPRIAAGNPLIGAAEWKGIGCAVCHKMDNGIPNPGIAWYDQQTGYYLTVTSSSQLCEKCHTDTQTLQYAIDLGIEAHVDFTCIDCHEPHSTAATCSSEACHSDVAFSDELNPDHIGHTSNHKSVSCVACHDASGLEVWPMEATGIWTTFRTTQTVGPAQTVPCASHNVTNQVMCVRCHFPGNPWHLAESVSE